MSLGPSVAGPAASSGAPPAGIAGTWVTDPSAASSSGDASFAGYRVREELANIGATEAVGRTGDVSGSMVIEGTTVTKAVITANLTTLQSDNRNRDRQLARQALETATFPAATFTLTQPIQLGAAPADGEVVAATATGDLTLHGVTRSVQVPLEARRRSGSIAVAGSLGIAFADFGIQKPQALLVLSVDDHGTLEFLVHLVPANG